MNREEKQQEIEELKQKLSDTPHFYMADTSALTVADVNELRGMCHEKGVEMRVAKNTLITKALEALEKSEGFEEILKGPTALFFSEVSNVPAKIIKEFRKTHEKPVLKAASIDSDLYVGDDKIEALASLKSKDEVIGDIIGLLQSPVKNVLGALQSGGHKLSGVLKTLSEKAE